MLNSGRLSSASWARFADRAPPDRSTDWSEPELGEELWVDIRSQSLPIVREKRPTRFIERRSRRPPGRNPAGPSTSTVEETSCHFRSVSCLCGLPAICGRCGKSTGALFCSHFSRSSGIFNPVQFRAQRPRTTEADPPDCRSAWRSVRALGGSASAGPTCLLHSRLGSAQDAGPCPHRGATGSDGGEVDDGGVPAGSLKVGE